MRNSAINPKSSAMTLNSLRHVHAPLIPFLFAAFFSSPLLGQGVDYIKSHFTKREYQVPMRDGVRLFTAVYAPKDTSQRYPILMIRTQSGVRPYGVDQFPNDLGPSPHFGK